MSCCTILYFLLYLSSVLCPSQQETIRVDCNDGDDVMCNNTPTCPCKTLNAALEFVKTDNMIIQIYKGNCIYNTTRYTTVQYNHITITGNGSDATIIECNSSSGIGLGFMNVDTISISGVTLSGCGQLRNSTTVNISTSSVMLFRAALYFMNVKNVTIDDVVVSNSIGRGVAMYDVAGNVSVTNSIFRNNSVPSHECKLYPGGGGFSVEFTYCKLDSNYTPSSSCYNTNEGALYIFHNCTFDHNNASTINKLHNPYVSKTFGIDNQQFGRGGGLSVFFKGHSIMNNISISNCMFDHNYAIWGGGFYSHIVDYSTGNVLTLENCYFTNNHCEYDGSLFTTGSGGGGARIAFLFYYPRSKVTNNSVQFKNCKFLFNKAYYGGGLSCKVSKESNVAVASNSLTFVDCTWAENIARTGSGVDIMSHIFPHGLSLVIEFINCNFTANSNGYSNSIAFPSGIGALSVDNIPVNVSGNCTFNGNRDSAIAGIGTYFMFSNNTSVMFYNNSGWHGAAMALLGNAYFIVYHNTLLQFINNSAVTKGGAIYYIDLGQKDFVRTQNCLFYYYDLSKQHYSDWVTTFYFSGNKALYGRSIYCTTLLTCIWGNLPGSVTVSGDDILKVFNWTGVFYYNSKDDRLKEIATDTAHISIGINNHVKIPPGQFYYLNISSVDDRNQTAYPVFFVATNDTSKSSIDSNTMYISNDHIKLHGKRNSDISVHLQSTSSRPWSVTVKVTLDECPPGFYYPSNDNNEAVCKCSTSTPEELYGVEDCDNVQLVAHLNVDFWAGYVNFNGSKILVTSDCPQGYCSDTRLQLPPNSSDIALENIVCANNRNRTLCGKCQQGYFVYVNSRFYQCGPCNDTLSNHGFLVLIASKYVPLTLMMFFIMFFDISLVNGPLNSFILFCQIISTMSLNIGIATTKVQGFASVLISIADFMYNIWYLNFFEYFVKPFCALKYDSTLPILVEEYFPAFYVLFLCVILFYILPWIHHCFVSSQHEMIKNCGLKMQRGCIRLRNKWSVKNSVVHSLTTFLVLSYFRITLVTFKLLTPAVLYGPGGQNSLYQKSVLWYDGTKSYFGLDHLPYASGALLMLIIFVLIPPLLLLSFPLLPALLQKLKLQDHWIVIKIISNPQAKCKPIFDAFQSCYKDNYRFFAALLFVYRILASAVFAFTPTTALYFVWLQGFLMFMLLLHCTCQPYKERWHNVVEGSMFIILATVAAITFYRLHEIETTTPPTNTSFWIQTIFLYCPLVYFIIYASISSTVYQKLRPKVKNAFLKYKNPLLKLRGDNSINSDNLVNSCGFPGRIEDDDSDRYSTDSKSTCESELPNDDNDEEQQQQQGQQQPPPQQQQIQSNHDKIVEMTYPEEWNDADDNHNNNAIPYGTT